jgi:hypothetical protein
MMTRTQLTPEYIKDMLGQFLSVAIKPTNRNLKRNVILLLRFLMQPRSSVFNRLMMKLWLLPM